MTNVAKLERKEVAEPVDPLTLLRAPFPPNQISKLPKPYKKDSPKGKCAECGGYHGLPAVHLDYVGHAALTDRLLDADPRWTWDPVPDPASLGLPTCPGGLWIKLTVAGVSRYGFGHPDGKSGGDAVKEVIGDALRNAAMRFGAALDLWHKGDLHVPDEGEDPPPAARGDNGPKLPTLEERANKLEATLKKARPEEIDKAWGLGAGLCALLSVEMPERLEALTALYEFRRPKAQTAENDSLPIGDDDIPEEYR